MEDGSSFWSANGPDPDSHLVQLQLTVGSSFTSTTYPPYNPSGTPPANFVFVDACDTFQNDYSDVLYPGLNLFDGSGVPSPKNQFAAGWKTKLKVEDTELIAEILMGNLSSGKTSYLSVLLAVQELQAMGFETYYNEMIDLSMIEMHGDPFTKIAGIYTGTHDITLDWYR